MEDLLDKEAQFIRLVSELTPRQKAFADAYILCLNAAQAAREIGICAKSASTSAGKFLRNKKVREYLDFYLTEAGLTNIETLKSVSDIARASVNDYFVVRNKTVYDRVKVTYAERIASLEADLEDLEQEPDVFLDLGVPLSAKDLAELAVRKKGVIKEIARYTILQRRNPNGFEWTTLERETEVAELDIVKLVRDKTAGRIKTYSVKENGEQRVEMYDALAALQMVARIQGLFEKDNSQLAKINPAITVNIKKAETNDEEYL